MKTHYRKDMNGFRQCMDLSPVINGMRFVCNLHLNHAGDHHMELPHLPDVAVWDDDRSTDQ
jgi:hypothetical protein